MAYRVHAILLLTAVLTAQTIANDTARTPIGTPIRELKFKDIRYLPRSLRDFGEKRSFVLVFTNTSCPLVQRYWPKLKRLEEHYRTQNVQFLAINASPEDEIQDIAFQAIEFGVEFPVVKDMDGSCVRAVGVERTPEVVILDRDLRLCYRGRIDDQVRLGGSRPDVTRDDLKQALDEVLAGQEVTVSESPVDGCRITLASAVIPGNDITFYEHILPLVQQHCQNCHRPRGEGPFPLISLEDVVGHAAMIREVVSERRMPPWHASRRHAFLNNRRLAPEVIRQFETWAASGTPAGDPAKAPPPRQFPDSKWEIGEPDLILTALETHSLPAEGFIDYRYVVLPHVFVHDTWVTAAEILPSNPTVVHHCNMAYWTVGKSFSDGNFITGRVPGGTAMTLDQGVAFRIPAGSVVGLQIHYTTNGKPQKNRMSVGFRYPRTNVAKELQHVQVTTSRFEIPPGAAAHPVTSSRTLPCNASGVGMFAHMHLRGKDMTFIAHYPDGETETLLTIPNYHYGWQENYRWKPGTKKFPQGTRIEVIAHYDNSAFNPFNPDPTVAVRNGPQTVNEMMFGFFFFTDDHQTLNLDIDSNTGHEKGVIDE